MSWAFCLHVSRKPSAVMYFGRQDSLGLILWFLFLVLIFPLEKLSLQFWKYASFTHLLSGVALGLSIVTHWNL